MIFLLFSAFICIFRLLVSYLTITSLLPFEVSVVLHHVPSTLSTMPVTTRSQVKRLKGLQCNHSSSSSKDLSIPSTFFTMSLCNNSTPASLTVPTCNSTTTTPSIIDNYNNFSSNHSEDSSLSLFWPSSSVSKFGNFKQRDY